MSVGGSASTSSTGDSRPFLSLIKWPPGATRQSLANGLEGVTGIDAATLRLRLGQAPPSIVGQIAPELTPCALRAIHRSGGDAFAVTLDQLASLGPAMRIRNMRIGRELLELDLWGGLDTTLPFEHVRLLVLGMLREEAQRFIESPWGPSRFGSGGGMSPSLAVGVTMGASGLAMASLMRYAPDLSAASQSRDVRTRSKLHIHDGRGGIYEIEGRRFDFGVLGELRQFTERGNMDALCELLSHLAPDEIVDPYYPLWKPPAGYHRLRIRGEMEKSDRPFAFYSRWVSLMYRHMLEP